MSTQGERSAPGTEGSLVAALAEAMDAVRDELGGDALKVTSLSVALVAERLIDRGWPAAIGQRGWLEVGREDAPREGEA